MDINNVAISTYATEHNELPILIRMMNEREAIGLFEEWKMIEEETKRLPILDQMENIYQVYQIYSRLHPSEIKLGDFGLYYMAYVYDKPNTMEEEYQQLLRDEVYNNRLLPFLTSKEQFFKKENIIILNSDTYSSTTFWERLCEKRKTYHKKDALLVAKLKKWNETILSKPKITEQCIIITDLFEEINYEPTNDLWGMFDNAQLSSVLPMTTYSSFYKMIDTFPVKKEWNVSSNQYITVYYQDERHVHCIYIYPDNVIIQSKFQEKGDTPEDVIEKINNTFSITLQRKQENQKRIQAICYIDSPSIIISKLLYFIYSNEIYSHFLFAEESRIAIKDKNYMYCYYYPNPRDTTHYITFTIRNVLEDETIPCTIPNKKYTTSIRVKIRQCNTYDDIEKTLHMLSQLIARYTEELPRIQSIFTQVEKKSTETKVSKKLKKKPTIVRGSIRGQEHLPTQLSEEEMKGNETNYYHININSEKYQWITDERKNEPTFPSGLPKPHVMVFPKNKEEEQFYYVCNTEKEYPYVNLKEFKDQQSNSVYYTPSCFKRIPGVKNNLVSYEKDEKEEKDEKVGPRPIKTGKSLKPNQFGLVQSWMERWFQLHNTNQQLIRRGISDSQLDSILYVLECITTKDFRIPDENRIKTRKKELLIDLDKDIYYNEMMTETYGMSRQEVIKQFETGYIDPLLYHSFLCRKYNVNIVYFSKRGLKNKDYFYLTLPRYHLIPTLSEIYQDTIGVVLNQGNEFNPCNYPLCELLTIQKSNVSTSEIILTMESIKWNRSSDFYRYIQQTEINMYGKQIVKRIPIDTIQSQTINEYGMVSWFHTDKGSIQCKTPCHSQQLPITQTIQCWTEKDVIEIQKRIFIAQDIHDDTYSNYIGYRLHYEGMDYFFPIKEKISYTLNQYRLYEKTSRYLVEYVYYGFSKYIHTLLQPSDDEKEEQITIDQITENIVPYMIRFATQFFTTIVMDELDYITFSSTINRELSVPNQLYNGTILHITSEFIKKKLMYNLLNEYHSNKESLFQYYREKKLRHFYVHTWDFIQYPHHYIVTTVSDYLTYVNHRTDKMDKASLVIRPFQTSPYILYLQNQLNGVKKWLMQPVSSIEEAFLRFNNWKNNHVNSTIENDEKDENEDQDESFHQVIWKNEKEYDYYPNESSLTDPTLLPILSVIYVETDKSLVQVMLPCDFVM
jgi:hypothetical protein